MAHFNQAHLAHFRLALSLSPSLWTERYESLRRHALQAHQILESDPLGLALLAQGGVAHWMCQRSVKLTHVWSK